MRRFLAFVGILGLAVTVAAMILGTFIGDRLGRAVEMLLQAVR